MQRCWKAAARLWLLLENTSGIGHLLKANCILKISFNGFGSGSATVIRSCCFVQVPFRFLCKVKCPIDWQLNCFACRNVTEIWWSCKMSFPLQPNTQVYENPAVSLPAKLKTPVAFIRISSREKGILMLFDLQNHNICTAICNAGQKVFN